MHVEKLRRLISAETSETFEKAEQYSKSLLASANDVASAFFREQGIDASKACISVTGSIGRLEALAASDMDLIPIWTGDEASYSVFQERTVELRRQLQEELEIDVSTPHRLMSCVRLEELLDPALMGRDGDNRRRLTQRILLLTESGQAGGSFPIDEVRRRILQLYAGNSLIERTASKHPLAACNDIARLFRTMCVDYKSRTESEPESWCYQNVKLRGARKFWYFSTLMAIAGIFAKGNDQDGEKTFEEFLKMFGYPPVFRLLSAAGDESAEAIGRTIDEYGYYLRAMGDQNTRDVLKRVTFDNRMDATLLDGTTNPFVQLHESSRRLHKEMVDSLEKSRPAIRTRVLDWFLL